MSSEPKPGTYYVKYRISLECEALIEVDDEAVAGTKTVSEAAAGALLSWDHEYHGENAYDVYSIEVQEADMRSGGEE